MVRLQSDGLMGQRVDHVTESGRGRSIHSRLHTDSEQYNVPHGTNWRLSPGTLQNFHQIMIGVVDLTVAFEQTCQLKETVVNTHARLTICPLVLSILQFLRSTGFIMPAQS